MAKMKPPKIEETEVPIVPDDALHRLLKACEGKAFRDRCDTALVFVFVDTRLRVSEMASIRTEPADDLDSYLELEAGVLRVVGKNRRQRRIPLGRKASKALDLYLFARAKHRQAGDPYLWIGERGRVGAGGRYQIITKRCEEAATQRIPPHQFRHTFAYKMQSAGSSDSDLVYLAGWKSRAMLNRYGV